LATQEAIQLLESLLAKHLQILESGKAKIYLENLDSKGWEFP
jgi:hypothetical protein